MSEIKCNSCGFENAAGGNFCEKCGKPLSAQQATQTAAPATAAAVMEPLTPLEDKYDNLRSISKFYKAITILIGCVALFAAWKVYEYSNSIPYAFIVLVLFLPISIMVGSQSDKIDISIAQEKNTRECAYYLKRIVEQQMKKQ